MAAEAETIYLLLMVVKRVDRRKVLKVLAVCLAVATVFLAYYTGTVLSYREFEVIYYWAQEIEHSAVAWNLTEPDSYILEAISTASPPVPLEDHPDYYTVPWVRAWRNETNFIDQAREHGDVWEIAYNGTYYRVECLGTCNPHPAPDLWVTPKAYVISNRQTVEMQVIGADISLGILWGIWVVGWLRIKKQALSTPLTYQKYGMESLFLLFSLPYYWSI